MCLVVGAGSRAYIVKEPWWDLVHVQHAAALVQGDVGDAGPVAPAGAMRDC